MRLGVTSLLTDRSMSPDQLAVEVEGRGFASLFLPEHTHLPVRAAHPPAIVEGVRPDDYRRSIDPFVGLAAAASVTRELRLGTGVCLVAQHDPVVLAKQVSTLDHLSGGRVDLGIGFGWNRAEAEDHGIAFGRRRAVAGENVRCMQALWADDVAEFHGALVDLAPCYSWPKPVQRAAPALPGRPGVPVLVGGGATPAVFDAVVGYGAGWMPIGGAGVAAALPELTRRWEEAGRGNEPLRVVPFGTVPTVGKLAHFADLGIDEVVLRLPSGPRDEMLPLLDELAGHLARAGGVPPTAGPGDGPGGGVGGGRR